MNINIKKQQKLEGLDKDGPERYDLRMRWYPEREHKTDKVEGPVDCMGDESFYKPSLLGRAYAEPNEVTAGGKSILKLKYVCGSEEIQEGFGGRRPGFHQTGIRHENPGEHPARYRRVH